MPARRVKTFKKELGHRAHRDHRTRRQPITKRQRKLRNDYRKQRERIIYDELDAHAQEYL